MISNELLSVVLGLYCGIKSIKNSEVIYWFDCIGEIREYSINIYELAHKCKEWALSKGYIINSGATTSNDWSSTIYKVIKENPYIKELSHTWGQSENEAIFRACQWILDKDSK